MLLSVEFIFTAADKSDPMSHNDFEIVNIELDEKKLPFRVESDPRLYTHLFDALYRLRQIMPRE